MIDLLLAIIEAIFAWILLALSFTGMGLWFRKLVLKANDLSIESLFDSFWTGLATVLILLNIWHFFYSINFIALVLIIVTGTSGLFAYRKQLKPLLRFKPKNKKESYLVVFLILFTILMADRTMGGVLDPDTGYFGLPITEWYRQYPVIPGLGNLQTCFAFNQSCYFLFSLLEGIPQFLPGFRAVNGVFMLVIIFQILSTAIQEKRTREHKLKTNFQCIFLVFLFIESLGIFINAASPENLLHCLCAIIAFHLFKLLVEQPGEREKEQLFKIICLLGASLITMKISTGIYAFTCILISWFSLNKKSRSLSELTKGLAILSIVLVPWIFHSIMLSGYLLFPCSITALPLEWTVPEESVKTRASWIQGWSRQRLHYSMVLNSFDWFPKWFDDVIQGHRHDFTIPLTGTILSSLIIFLHRKRVKGYLPLLYIAWVGALGILPVYWFAPDPSYCAGMTWTMAAALMTVSIDILRVRHAWLVALLLLPPALIFLELHLVKSKAFPLNEISPIKVGIVRKFVTQSGLIVGVTDENQYSWKAKIPTTAYPNPYLRLREPGNIRSGFVSDVKGDGVGVGP